MGAKSFTLKTSDGVYSVTSVVIERKLVFTTDSTSESNRIGVLDYLGYNNNPAFEIDDEYRNVYRYYLSTKRGNKFDQILELNSKEDGEKLLKRIWNSLCKNIESRLVDLTV